MARENRSPEVFTFGTHQVDVRAGELRKQGVRVKLQEQPFLVLKVLLERSGEIVAREELRSQIWSADTFVDFDNSLNTAINKLREALGDSAESPRFIETVPRRGYRFIAPVVGIDGKRADGKDVPTGRWKLAVLIAVLAAASVGGGLYWRSRQARRLTEKDTIVLGDFANSTGDSVFDGTLREGLSVQLEQSPFLSLVSEEEIHQTLRMMGQPTNALLMPEIAREVCQRTGSAASLNGSIALIGTKYNLILKAVSCVNGDLLASAQAQVGDKSRVLDALGKVASDMRGKLGESLSTVQKYNTPLEQATTPSLEALQAFSLGDKAAGLEGDAAAAVAFCQRAIQFDPNFASAYDLMGGANQALGETALSAENIRKAFDLRKGVSELEKQEIEFDYYFVVIGDLVKARQSAVLGEQIYPRQPDFHRALGLVSNALGQYETGLKEHMEALRLVPHNSLNYRLVSYTYLLLNQAEKAVSTAQEAHAKGLDSSLVPILYAIAFYRNAMEVGPTCHYMMGGIRVDAETAESTVPGLFAAGEAAAGLHGANRLGGNSLSDLLVFGRRAGLAAAEHAKRAGTSAIDSIQIEAAERELVGPFECSGGESPYAVHRDLQETMHNLVGIFRNEADLKKALAELERLNSRAERVLIEGSRLYNPGWHLARDLQSMLIISKAVALSALARSESRGAHSRIDFPNLDANWGMKNNIIVRDGNEMKLRQSPVPPVPEELKPLLAEEKADTARKT